MAVRFCKPWMSCSRLGVTVRSCSAWRAAGFCKMPCEKVLSSGVAICVSCCTCAQAVAL